MSNNNHSELSLKLATIDCVTTTKYYQLNQKPTSKQKQKIKQYFKYYTKKDFQNPENVAGKTTGWMCKSEDVEIIEKILEITKTRAKQRKQLQKIQNKTTNEQTHKTRENIQACFPV